jgi:hypothetical protein
MSAINELIPPDVPILKSWADSRVSILQLVNVSRRSFPEIISPFLDDNVHREVKHTKEGIQYIEGYMSR